TVATVKRANASYSAGFMSWHRERDEMRTQLELAMRWGAVLASRDVEDPTLAGRVLGLARRVAELESDAAIAVRQADAQIRHLLDALEEEQSRRAMLKKHGDRLREWLLAARAVYQERGAPKPETLVEIDVLLADYDLAAAGFGR